MCVGTCVGLCNTNERRVLLLLKTLLKNVTGHCPRIFMISRV